VQQAFLDLLPELADTVELLVHRYQGMKLAQILADIEHRLDRKLPKNFESRYRERVAELFERELKPIPGVCEMLASTDYPRCVASSGPRAKIRQALEISGLATFFNGNIFSSMKSARGSQSQDCSCMRQRRWVLCRTLCCCGRQYSWYRSSGSSEDESFTICAKGWIFGILSGYHF